MIEAAKKIAGALIFLSLSGSMVKVFAGSSKENTNETVASNKTHLLWQRCSMGQKNDSLCSGEASATNWDSAMNYCKGLKLRKMRWRLPGIDELNSIIYKAGKPAAINNSIFPNTVDYGYWSSSADDKGRTAYAKVLSFFDGSTGIPKKTFLFYVRCVSMQK